MQFWDALDCLKEAREEPVRMSCIDTAPGPDVDAVAHKIASERCILVGVKKRTEKIIFASERVAL